MDMNVLKKLEEKAEGKKTYIVAAVMVVLSGLRSQGYIDDTSYELILNILVGLGLVTLRLGMKGK